MKPGARFLKKSDWSDFWKRIYRSALYGTVSGGTRSTFQQITPENIDRMVLFAPPPVESLKGFLFPVAQCVAVYPAAPGKAIDPAEAPPRMIVGARACDLHALEILDKVFLGDQATDPFYQARRENTFIVTTDCVEPASNCFCNLVGGKPYPEKGFDLNFSPLADGFLITSGSDKGAELLTQAEQLLTDATPEHLAQQDQLRTAVTETLAEQNKEFTPASSNKEKYVLAQVPREKWAAETACCVECGACNFICPTCHCFLLHDQPTDDAQQSERCRTWDSCLLANFAKMAGVGGIKPTPRPELTNRFENRIRHKFEWMPENLEILGCVGCGRCIEACLGASDLRKVIKEIQ